ncbi:MAG: SDR family NAD(P)-dependent oxidoreductase [Gammaproteobacteria bacterium]|jgi:NAD(P)-dependent dehydrogenase (short-subunit alcohol dehydrogenase family)
MKQRIAVVTGANRGLGLQTARELAMRGYRAVLGSRDMAKADAAAADLRAAGLEVHATLLDVRSDAIVETFVSAVKDEHGRIDVLVNNAGSIVEADLGHGAPPSTSDVPAEMILRAFDNNAVGAYRLCRSVLPLMNAAGYGRIVNVSSGMGALNEMVDGWPAYRISKAALNAVTRIFAAEAGSGVKINSVCPGWVRTDMGGANAPRDIEEGAAGIVWAATLPDDGPSGGFFRDRQSIAW